MGRGLFTTIERSAGEFGVPSQQTNWIVQRTWWVVPPHLSKLNVWALSNYSVQASREDNKNLGAPMATQSALSAKVTKLASEIPVG